MDVYAVEYVDRLKVYKGMIFNVPVYQILEVNGRKVTSDEVPPEYDLGNKVICRSAKPTNSGRYRNCSGEGVCR